jgi:predicted AlkP superfamily phosphohydrolase/phosphomutase
VFDIPLTGIDRQINGLHVVEWGSHDPNYGFCASSSQLKADILARFGRHPVRKVCDSYERSPAAFLGFKEDLLQGIKLKTALTKHYLKLEDWDFFAQVFSESHCVGHQCWHLHDSEHPNYNERTSAVTGNPVRQVYGAIDSALGDILNQIGENTIVFFLASHGMAHNVGAQFLLPSILLRLKVAQPISRASNTLKGSLKTMGMTLPEGIKKGLRPIRNLLFQWSGGRDPRNPASLSGISPENSLCFPLDNGLSVGGIRVNLAGREPNGIVKPGAEMDAFCSNLAASLLKIVDLQSGRPMIRQVHRTADLYRGEHIDHLPDILVEWDDEQRIGSRKLAPCRSSRVKLFSRDIGKIGGTYDYCRTGDHRPEGLFVAMGPGIKPGRLDRPVSIMDAPTFAHLLGTDLPDAEGRIIPGIK